MLPEDFVRRFKEICPSSQLDHSLQSFSVKKTVSFRLNRLQENSQKYLHQLQELNPVPVHWINRFGIEAYTIEASDRETLTYSDAAESGAIYIQSLSSMVAPLILSPQENDWILDLAAAPGGKTILMAELMKNTGTISAVEPVRNRFFRLRANLERMGVTNTRTYLKDGRAIGNLKPDCFDGVMLDAPCSSESRFKSGVESSYEHWSLKKVSECAKKQKRLILSGYDALKPGNKMLYSTCSFSPEENEKVLEHLLKRHQDAQLLDIDLDLPNSTSGLTEWSGKKLPEDCAKARRLWPDQSMDGFFLALIKKP